MPTLLSYKSAGHEADPGKGRRRTAQEEAKSVQLRAIQEQKAADQATAMPPPRLVQAAHQFEGQLMKELLKPMTDYHGLAGADDDDADSADALSEFASEAMGQSLSERGGLGIAHRIIQELSHSGNHHESGKVTGNLHQG